MDNILHRVMLFLSIGFLGLCCSAAVQLRASAFSGAGDYVCTKYVSK